MPDRALAERVSGSGTWYPSSRAGERILGSTIEAKLPGVEEKDISVTFANGVQTIRGEKKPVREETTTENVHLSERSVEGA